MLTLYRLHGPTCKKGYQRLDRTGLNCTCPVHVEGKLGSGFLRKSTKTRSMAKASAMVEQAEKRGAWEEQEQEPVTAVATLPQGKSLSEAVDEFLTDAADPRGRNLANPTVSKYRTLLVRLKVFGERRGLVAVSQIDFAQLTAFKREWPTGSRATTQNITRLRTFFTWCRKHKWIEDNPAEDLDPPQETVVERMPYTPEEMAAILHAARTIELDAQQPVNNEEIETFILLQRWAGMAISDAGLLQTSEIRGDEVRYYRKKMMRHKKRILVVVALPEFLLKRIKALPLQHGRYYFAHGEPTLATQVEAWRKRLAQVFTAAKIQNPGSHRFRHTFATHHLTRRVDIELVSRWLGHASIKVTQEHYNHFIEERIQAASGVLRDQYASSSDQHEHA